MTVVLITGASRGLGLELSRQYAAEGATVIATLDESSYQLVGHGGQDLHMGDHPIAWTRCVGNGRSFYSAIGHRPEIYSEPTYATLLEQGIAWAAGGGATVCRNGAETL